MPDSIPPPLFVNPEGAIVPLPPELVQDALAGGYKPATPQQAATYAAQQKFGTTGQTVAAGAEAIGRGLTLGTSSLAERAFGVPAEDIAGREQANPILAPALELGAAAAPVLLTGGAAAPEEGASLFARAAAKTGPAFAQRLGEGAAEIAGKALPEATTTLGKLAASAVHPAADWAAQGVIYDAGHIVHEAAVGDPNLTAGNIIAELGLSAVLGGGLGATLGIGGHVVSAALSKAQGTTSGLRDMIVERYPAFAEAMGQSGEDAAILAKNRTKYAAGKTTEEILAEEQAPRVAPEPFIPGEAPAKPEPITTAPAPKDAEEFTGELKDALSEHAAQMQEQISKGWARMKSAEFEPMLNRVDPKAAVGEWARISNQIRDTVESMRADPSLYEQASIRRLEVIQNDLRKAVTEGGNNPKTIYNQLEETKRLLFDESKAPAMPSRSQVLTSRAIKDVYGTVKRSLEDVDVWGEAGARQSARNQALSEFKAAEKNYDKAFTKKEARRTGDVRVPDAGKIGSFVKNLGEDINADRERYLADYIKASNNLLGEIDKTAQLAGALDYDTTAAKRLVDRTAQAVDSAQQNVQTATAFGSQEEANAAARAAHKLEMDAYRVDLKEKGSAAKAAEKDYREGVKADKADVKSRAKTMEGGHDSIGLDALGIAESVHNPLLAPVYAAYKAGKFAASPARVMKTLATLEKLNETISNRINAQASTLVRAGSRAADVGQTEVAAGLPKVYALEPKAAVKNYERQTGEVGALAGAPARMFGQLQGAVSDGLGEHAPNTAAALTTASTRAVAFLASKIPQPATSSPYMPKIPPTRQQMATWNNYRDAVYAPMTVLKKAMAGTLTPESIEAMEAVHPDLLDSMRFAIAHQIQIHGTPPVSQWTSIELLMGQPMFRSPESALASAASYNAIRQMQKQMGATRMSKAHSLNPHKVFNANATGVDKLSAGSTSSTL